LESASSRLSSQLIATQGSSASIEKQKLIDQRRADAFLRLQVNIACLRAVSSFRMQPSQPEGALYLLQQAQRDIDPTARSKAAAIFLELSLGEIACQAGDIVAGLGHFKRASACDPAHPLPYTNAARAYQQLQQWSLAEYHLKTSLSYDASLAMTYVDIAQGRSLTGRIESALQLLDAALPYARHVSEIRDVLAARTVTSILHELQQAGVYSPPATSFP
jgi:tetratricopeptide (TPR) repeat protein